MKTAAMKFNQSKRLRACFAALTLTLSGSYASAQSESCDSIAKDVFAAVQKDSGKVLMIVEDAMVINESCACEIIKAAISASKADGALVNQIVQTGISVAPKMSGVIMDCATAIAPSSGITSAVTAVTTSGKEVKNPVPSVTPDPVEEDFNPVTFYRPFLIQPPAGGFIPRKRDNDPISPVIAVPHYP